MSDTGWAEGDSVTPERLARRLRRGDPVSVLDVRDRDEYATWRIRGRSVAADQVPHVRFLQASVTGDPADLVPDQLVEPMVVVCGRGAASADVADMLVDSGVKAVNLEGGMDAWARTVLADPIVDTNELTVVQYQRPSSGCLSALVVSDGRAVVIDPLRAFADQYVSDARARDADLQYALDTHVHADHVSGVRAVADRTGARVALPAGATERGLAFDARLLDDGESLSLGSTELKAVHAPGHTSEMTVFQCPASGPRRGELLFTGDALFLRSVGRPDLEASDAAVREYAAQLHATLHDRVLSLPDTTAIVPGHFADLADARSGGVYAAPLADLRTLPILELDREAFVDRVVTAMPPQPANFERIVEANLGRATLDEDAAFEAELGPNNCAVSAD